MKKPGEWALVYETNPQHAYNLKHWLSKGKYKVPDGDWEFTAHRTEDDGGELYARYLGPVKNDPAVAAG